MSAGSYNLFIDQGSDYAIQLTVKEQGSAKDLTGYFARAQMRSTKSSAAVTATFTCTITDPSEGIIKVELANSITETILAGLYYYDLELFSENDAIVTRLLEGQVTVTQEVTR